MTLADIEAQERIAEGLARAFPGVPVIGEEGGLDEDPGAGARWYVDPIDGTHAFLEGLAHWGPTIGLVVDDRPILGALYLPRLDELWVAARGKGAWVDDLRLQPDPIGELRGGEVLYVPSRFHRRPVPWRGKIRALGSTAVHMAQVASGAGAACVIGRWSPWDVACGIVLVEEAGRVITDLASRPVVPDMAIPPIGTERAPRAPFLAGDPTAVAHVAALARNLQDA